MRPYKLEHETSFPQIADFIGRAILSSKEKKMAINKELLDLLVCPKCKGEIHLKEDGTGLICDACKLMYPIEDDIPVMLIDEAKDISASA